MIKNIINYLSTELILALIATLHYLISLSLWGIFLFAAIKMKYRGDKIDWWCFLNAIPPSILFLTASISVFLIIKQHGWGKILLIGVLGLSLILFFYDIGNRHYQLQTLNSDGCKVFYCTWWWYSWLL